MNEQQISEIASDLGMATSQREENDKKIWFFERDGYSSFLRDTENYTAEDFERGVNNCSAKIGEFYRKAYVADLVRTPLADLEPPDSSMCVLVTYAAMDLIESELEAQHPDGYEGKYSIVDEAVHCGEARVYLEPYFEADTTTPEVAVVPVSEWERFHHEPKETRDI